MKKNFCFLISLFIPSVMYSMELTNNNSFHHALLTNNVLKVQQLLNINPSLVNNNDSQISPLIGAITFGYDEIVKILLTSKANVNFKNNKGDSPLHVASTKNDSHIVYLLLQYGADLNAKNKQGKSPLQLAQAKVIQFNNELTRVLNNPPMQQIQIRQGFPFKNEVVHFQDKENVIQKKNAINHQTKVVQLLQDWPSYLRYIKLKKAGILSTLLMSLDPRLGKDSPMNVLNPYLLKTIAEFTLKQSSHHTLDHVFALAKEGKRINFSLFEFLKSNPL